MTRTAFSLVPVAKPRRVGYPSLPDQSHRRMRAQVLCSSSPHGGLSFEHNFTGTACSLLSSSIPCTKPSLRTLSSSLSWIRVELSVSIRLNNASMTSLVGRSFALVRNKRRYGTRSSMDPLKSSSILRKASMTRPGLAARSSSSSLSSGVFSTGVMIGAASSSSPRPPHPSKRSSVRIVLFCVLRAYGSTYARG